MEVGSQNQSRNGLLGPNSIVVVYMDPLGNKLASLNSAGLSDMEVVELVLSKNIFVLTQPYHFCFGHSSVNPHSLVM